MEIRSKLHPADCLLPGAYLLSYCPPLPAQQNNNDIQDASKPNIVFIFSDDLSFRDLSSYGQTEYATPNIDRLAAGGTVFERAFCTTASCSASRSVILTGLHNHANGQYGHTHDYHHFRSFENLKSLPVLLEEAGYRTGHAGKYHIAPESVYRFQHRFQAESRSTIEMAEACEQFIKEGNSSPFFLYFCFSDPHRGGGFAEELPHQPDRFGNRPEGYPGVEEVAYDPDEVIAPPFLPDNPETRAEIAQYYQAVSRLDQGVGKLLEYLEESGKFDNTLIIYISDNGMAFPGAKTTLYEAGIQLPCIVKMPGQKEGRRTDVMVSWVDLTPAILDVAGALSSDSLFHGNSFLPLLQGRSADSKEVYASHTFHEVTMYYPMRVARGEKYKLIMNIAHGLEYPFASDLYASRTWQSILKSGRATLGEKPVSEFLRRPPFELYDLENDTWETNNLVPDPRYDEILDGLKRKIKRFQEATADPWAYKWEYE